MTAEEEEQREKEVRTQIIARNPITFVTDLTDLEGREEWSG